MKSNNLAVLIWVSSALIIIGCVLLTIFVAFGIVGVVGVLPLVLSYTVNGVEYALVKDKNLRYTVFMLFFIAALIVIAIKG